MKWYQLHLSTLLAVMLLAGLLVWLNVRLQHTAYSRFPGYNFPLGEFQERGFPFLFESQYDDAIDHLHDWDLKALTMDIATCLLLLALAGAGIEWATRRMKPGAP